jgi:hypothetical protein
MNYLFGSIFRLNPGSASCKLSMHSTNWDQTPAENKLLKLTNTHSLNKKTVKQEKLLNKSRVQRNLRFQLCSWLTWFPFCMLSGTSFGCMLLLCTVKGEVLVVRIIHLHMLKFCFLIKEFIPNLFTTYTPVPCKIKFKIILNILFWLYSWSKC